MDSFFTDSKENTMFSHLNRTDLLDYLYDIEAYQVGFRSVLDLPHYVTFGVELEYERSSKKRIGEIIDANFANWMSKGDGSLISGGEITSPIMTDNEKHWQELKEICANLELLKVDTSKRAGGHIHFGAQTVGNLLFSWINFIKIYTAYEHILIRFGYGDKTLPRKNLKKYAKPMADLFYNKLSSLEDSSSARNFIRYILYYIQDTRYYAVNFRNIDTYSMVNFDAEEKNTIEFRFPNASSNPIIWQNNINALAKLLLTAREKQIDSDFINWKLNNEFKYGDPDFIKYNMVHLKDALELVDIIFDNNLDKTNFLRQYLKSISDISDVGTKSKLVLFTK